MSQYPMKKLILVPLLFIAVSAHAAPNVWRTGAAQGYVEYSIQDSKQRTLWIACEAGVGDEYDHSARLEMNGKSYENSDSKYPLTFLINGGKEVTPPGTTNWRNGANAWNEFIEGMSQAKKIDVFLNNKKITTFTPNRSSVNEVAEGMLECGAKW